MGEEVTGNVISLLKLQGSLNWVYCPELKRVVPWTMEAYFKDDTFPDITAETTLVRLGLMEHLNNFRYEDKEVIPDPVLIPPTWNKGEHYQNVN